MNEIQTFMLSDHRRCDALFTAAEREVAVAAWDRAKHAFIGFQQVMQQHFSAEEEVLFPAFERKTGMTMGPTQVMRDEHVQMNDLMTAAYQSLLAKDADDYAGNTETLLIMMQQHNMKEEHVLYPMCDQHLADLADVLLPKLRQQLDVSRPA
jgi:hemerythrin-like domain-containing protein